MSFQNHNERREAALKAKQAMLEKFKNKAETDPQIVEERAAAAKVREEKLVPAEQRRRDRVEMEKLERKVAAEAAAKAERERVAREAVEAAKRRKAAAEAAELREFEMQARRDLATAAARKR